jgi:DNA-binding MarR family transcriptional regulator
MQTSEPFVDALQEWLEVSTRVSMRNFIQYTRDKGFSIPQLGALYHISRKGSSVSGLGENLGVSSAAASQMLEHLVQQGLISRIEDPIDRRMKQLTLTEKGKQILHESIHAREGWLESLASSMTGSEKEQVCPALMILVSKVKQLE